MNIPENNGDEELRALKGDNVPFIVPPDYFENLPGRIMDRINSVPDTEKTSAVNPFLTPDGYFEKLPYTIADRVSDRKRLGRVRDAIFRPRVALVLSIAMLIVAAGMYYMFRIQTMNKSNQEITADEIKNSLYIYSMDEDMMLDALPLQQANANDNSFEQYLIENNIEISQIINEL